MSNDISTYIILDENIRAHMDFISECRDQRCPVPNKHPFYAVPEKPPFYYGKRPCMPVVPTWLQKGRVMILGMYPTCRFANVPNLAGGSEEEVPIRDIDEPFENSRYFDTYGVRDVRSGTVLYEEYIEPLGLNEEDVWITNLVKCFLFKEEQVTAYEKVGWQDPQYPIVYTTRDKYFDAAKPCFERNLEKEVLLGQPKLILTMGSAVCQMVHADEDYNPADNEVFREVRGKLLRANHEDSGPFERHPLFKDKNVFCFYHPAYIRKNGPARTRHREEHIPVAKAFLDEQL